MQTKYADQIEFARIHHAVRMALETGKTKVPKSGSIVIFNEAASDRQYLSLNLESARQQMATAGIDYSSITPAEAFGLTEDQWQERVDDPDLLAYRITKKSLKWFQGTSIPEGYTAQIEINDHSRSWEHGASYLFVGIREIVRGRYGTKTTVIPMSREAAAETRQRAANSRQPKKIERWLGFVEDNVAESKIFQHSVGVCRSLGINRHPDLQTRLETAIREAHAWRVKNKAKHDLDIAESRCRDHLRYIRAGLNKHWNAKGEETVKKCATTLSTGGKGEVAKGFLARLEALRVDYKRLQEVAATGGFSGPTYKLWGGSGYGFLGWSEGQVINNSSTGIESGEPEFLFVQSTTKKYFREDGMSFGVGDESGYIYSAICREATEIEAAPLKAKLARQQADLVDWTRLQDIKMHICDIGERPDCPQPKGKKLFDTQDIYGGGDWFVVGPEWIWYVKNNGYDGEYWGGNNVRTGGAGAIGWRIPVNHPLAEELELLQDRIGKAIQEEKSNN